jgi:hypothetical protein
VYQFIRANGGWDNWSMIQIEQYNATDKRSLETRERHYIEQLGATLNKQIPCQTRKEWYQDNVEHIKEQNKEYKQDNIEKLKKQSKEYRQANSDKLKQKHDCYCGGKYVHSNKSRHFKSKKHCDYETEKK